MLRPYRTYRPTVDPSAYVDESAQVIGQVTIGPGSSVWMNAVLRGDVHWIRIGGRTNVQDGTIVHVMRDEHPCDIGDEVTIGHAALLHGCTVGDRCLIGMGVTILNGATVGSDVIIAAGSLVTEGTRIPDGTLAMGRPAQVRRALTDADRVSIRDYAERYLGYAREYRSGIEGDSPR